MKKIIDSNGRLFGLISVIDVIVLLAVLVLALALVVKQGNLSPAAQSGTAGLPVTYQLLVENIEDDLIPSIVVGDQLFDHDQKTGGTIGAITAIEVLPSYAIASLPDGSVVDALVTNHSDVLLTVEGQCDVVDGHYRFNNVYELGINAHRNFYTPFIGFPASVISIG